MDESLDTRDVRALLRLLGELRELGADPAAWRSHLVSSLEELCGAQMAVISELQVKQAAREGATNCAQAVSSLQSIDYGVDPSSRARFYREVYWTDHKTDDTLAGIVPLYGTAFTIQRKDVVDDRRWERSMSANDRYRANGCDDFIMSMAPVSSLGVISSLEIFRPRGRRFTSRERLIVELLHEDLANDWNRSETRKMRLTPRQRQVLGLLAEGASEKEVAYALGLSAHTAHDHVKAIYRAFGARSRGELLARLSKQTQPRTRLIAEGA